MSVVGWVVVAVTITMQAALAQSRSPSDFELSELRARSAEARIDYLSAVVVRLQDDAKATAKWWADYIGMKHDTMSERQEAK